MDEELVKEVKIRLRSLVVSSPTQMDSRMLMRDYYKMLGTHIPLAKMGYRDFVTFLRERCGDSFLLSGPQSNPILTVIVPDSSKHIDNFVQRSKVPSTSKVRVKRRSIPESKVNPPKQDRVYDSFIKRTPSITEQPKKVESKAPDIVTNTSSQDKENVNHHQHTTVTSNDVKNFLKKRLPLYNSLYNLEEALSDKGGALSQDNDSGSIQHTSSSSSSTKALQFEELKSEIMELITAAEEGVWCTDLIRLYRERYHRELNFTRFGYTSIVSLAYALEARVHISRPEDTGDWLLVERARAERAAASARGRPHVAACARSRVRTAPPPCPRPDPDPDDALPGVEFDSDVFPADCVRYLEAIPALSVASLQEVHMLEVMVGEVYSPSHFWLIRCGDDYSGAMEAIMDEMTTYYNGEGSARVLSRGAVRVGHYCAARYAGDWHRSLIVKVLDSDTVKVRHVDYGTVETVAARSLRPLRRAWAALPAQAVRARLAAVRPGAAARRWPHAAATRFLELVADKRFYAIVVAADAQQDVLETLLIDTSGSADVSVGEQLVRAGYADARADSALWTAESYLYPRFEALEGGDTPTLAEIKAYLCDGIELEYVEAYRLHVPACVSPAPPAPAPPAPPAPASASPGSDAATLHDFYLAAPPSPPRTPSPQRSDLATRIPLLWPAPDPDPCLTSEHLTPSESSCSSCSRPSLFLPPVPQLPSAPQSPPVLQAPPVPLAPPIPLAPLVPQASPVPQTPPVLQAPADSRATPVRQAPTDQQATPVPQATPIPRATPDPQAPAVLSTALTSPPPAHMCPVIPVPDPRPSPGGTVEPPAKPQFTVNPEAQPFTPRMYTSPPVVAVPCPYAGGRGLFPLPPGLPPPPGAAPGGCWFGPYAAPGAGATLSAADCATYQLLARVNPTAAHWFMVGALGRGAGALAGPVRAPPGFGA